MNNKKILSQRELEVLKLMKDVLTNYEIANRLHISYHTVKANADSIYQKLHCRNKLEAVLIGLKEGYLEL